MVIPANQEGEGGVKYGIFDRQSMKAFLIVIFPVLFFSVCKAQSDSISLVSDGARQGLICRLVIGNWSNIDDTNWSIEFSEDSMIERNYTKDGKYCTIMRYAYSVGFGAPSGSLAGTPDLINWKGFYVEGWDDSNPQREELRTFAIFSVSNKYLRINQNGELLFRKKLFSSGR